MSAYADTSFLFSLYYPQEHSDRAIAYFGKIEHPLRLTSLNRFEFVNAIELSVFRKAMKRKAGAAVIKDFEADLGSGAIVMIPCDWSRVHAKALELSTLHTAKTGGRGTDILQVAAALELEASEFLTFDVRQGQIAKAAGLKVRS